MFWRNWECKFLGLTRFFGCRWKRYKPLFRLWWLLFLSCLWIGCRTRKAGLANFCRRLRGRLAGFLLHAPIVCPWLGIRLWSRAICIRFDPRKSSGPGSLAGSSMARRKSVGNPLAAKAFVASPAIGLGLDFGFWAAWHRGCFCGAVSVSAPGVSPRVFGFYYCFSNFVFSQEFLPCLWGLKIVKITSESLQFHASLSPAGSSGPHAKLLPTTRAISFYQIRLLFHILSIRL